MSVNHDVRNLKDKRSDLDTPIYANSILRPEFIVLYILCHVKKTFLTTLLVAHQLL